MNFNLHWSKVYGLIWLFHLLIFVKDEVDIDGSVAVVGVAQVIKEPLRCAQIAPGPAHQAKNWGRSGRIHNILGKKMKFNEAIMNN